MIATIFLAVVVIAIVVMRLYINARLKPMFAWLDEEAKSPSDFSGYTVEELGAVFIRAKAINDVAFDTEKKKAKQKVRYDTLQTIVDRMETRRLELVASGDIVIDEE